MCDPISLAVSAVNAIGGAVGSAAGAIGSTAGAIGNTVAGMGATGAGLWDAGKYIYEQTQNEQRYQEQMDRQDTAHQREMKDLMASGINPVYGMSGSGAQSQSYEQSKSDANPFEKNLAYKMMLNNYAQSQADVIISQEQGRKEKALADMLELDAQYYKRTKRRPDQKIGGLGFNAPIQAIDSVGSLLSNPRMEKSLYMLLSTINKGFKYKTK